MRAEIKPICGNERVVLSEVIPLETPFTLYIFPTTYCNFKCNYCGHSLGLDKMKAQYGFSPEMMSMETFDKVVNQARDFNQKFRVVSLTGHGEPMMNSNLPYMINAVKDSGIAERIEIITNGSLLNEALSVKLIESGLDVIRISIQGLSSKKYKEVCGIDLDFDYLIKQIRYFWENKKQCKVYVKIMDIALEKGEEEKFYALFEDICDRMYIEKCRPVYDGVDYEQAVYDLADRYGRAHEKRQVCPFPFFMLGIFPNGDVEPCDTIYKPIILGNVHNQTLLEMWRGDELMEFRKMQLNKERACNEKCAKCHAPDDVAHPEDDLDKASDQLLIKIMK